jgi:hypothetical protein
VLGGGAPAPPSNAARRVGCALCRPRSHLRAFGRASVGGPGLGPRALCNVDHSIDRSTPFCAPSGRKEWSSSSVTTCMQRTHPPITLPPADLLHSSTAPQLITPLMAERGRRSGKEKADAAALPKGTRVAVLYDRTGPTRFEGEWHLGTVESASAKECSVRFDDGSADRACRRSISASTCSGARRRSSRCSMTLSVRLPRARKQRPGDPGGALYGRTAPMDGRTESPGRVRG